MIWLLACAEPQLVTTEVWSSRFEEVGAQPVVTAAPGDAAFEVAVLDGEPTSLRVYVEEAPGEPWTGPLQVDLDGLVVAFEGPTSPRSTPDATLYEAEVSGWSGRSVTLVDGPQPGRTLALR